MDGLARLLALAACADFLHFEPAMQGVYGDVEVALLLSDAGEQSQGRQAVRVALKGAFGRGSGLR